MLAQDKRKALVENSFAAFYFIGSLLMDTNLDDFPQSILAYLVDCGGPCGTMNVQGAISSNTASVSIFTVLDGPSADGTAVTGCTRAADMLSLACTGVTDTMFVAVIMGSSGGRSVGGLTSITADQIAACSQVKKKLGDHV